ncbi:hypothetical protein BKA63DRAFT_406864, partial [Paraphoma chrysanthemicola]
VLTPLKDDQLPEPQDGGPLFLPADGDRLWYLGFLQPWNNFNEQVIKFWKSSKCRAAFAELNDEYVLPPRNARISFLNTATGAEKLESFFQRHVLDVVENVYNKVLETKTMQGAGVPKAMHAFGPEHDDLGNAELEWKPTFVFKADTGDGDEDDDLETRLLGHVEYLGGRDDALVIALDNVKMNSWGSFRCVVGKIAQYMLMSSTRYAFLVSASEITFLKFDVIQKTQYNVPAGKDPVDLFHEPWLLYSEPIKFEDVLEEEDEQDTTVSVKMALLYLLYCSTKTGWELPADTGRSLNYFAKTKAGEGWKPVLPWLKK